jgi:gamma-glutamyl hercynylcysteine S-oxide synthase
VQVKRRIAVELERVRKRSLGLLDPLDEGALVAQHSPLMSPLVWDLAHVGNYEDIWLVRGTGADAVRPDIDDRYDAFRHPRAERLQLELLTPADARGYLREVRERALERLDVVALDDDVALLCDGFVYGMVAQHEHQHDETMLATLQLMDDGYRPLAAPAPAAAPLPAEEVLVEAGPCILGTSTDPWAYDNERPAHEVDVPAFHIDVGPVTNRAYLEFLADGGYDDPRLWSVEGWAWRTDTGSVAPLRWQRDGTGWVRDRFGWVEAVPADEPVQHVSWFEADAYARWAGKRLPTETEWEKAATWDPGRGVKRRYPWGDADPGPEHANLGGSHYGPATVGAYLRSASAYGCVQQIGDVWEWTATDFAAYPGFRSFPYREYSEVFFGPRYKVLRGGSWATDPLVVRGTFRNWDLPVRRQIFTGFRCARDA